LGPIQGTSFKFTESGKIEAFEYSVGRGPVFSDPFLGDLSRFILDNNLSDVLGILDISDGSGTTTELNLVEERISVVAPDHEVPKGSLRPTPTSWVLSGGTWKVHSQCLPCLPTGEDDAIRSMINELLYKRSLVLDDLV
jgi:hypothetical protein